MNFTYNYIAFESKEEGYHILENKFENKNKKYKTISIQSQYIIYLSDEGEIYMAGNLSQSQKEKINSDFEMQKLLNMKPMKMKNLFNFYVSAISTTSTSIHFLTSFILNIKKKTHLKGEGILMAWGRDPNNFGILGLGKITNQPTPIIVPNMSEIRFILKKEFLICNRLKSISISKKHGAAIDIKGRIYFWGMLGKKKINFPKLLETPSILNANILMTHKDCLAIITMGGHLFLLGSLSKNNELRQKEDAVQILKDSFINNAVLIKQFCVALDNNGKIYIVNDSLVTIKCFQSNLYKSLYCSKKCLLALNEYNEIYCWTLDKNENLNNQSLNLKEEVITIRNKIKNISILNNANRYIIIRLESNEILQNFDNYINGLFPKKLFINEAIKNQKNNFFMKKTQKISEKSNMSFFIEKSFNETQKNIKPKEKNTNIILVKNLIDQIFETKSRSSFENEVCHSKKGDLDLIYKNLDDSFNKKRKKGNDHLRKIEEMTKKLRKSSLSKQKINLDSRTSLLEIETLNSPKLNFLNEDLFKNSKIFESSMKLDKKNNNIDYQKKLDLDYYISLIKTQKELIKDEKDEKIMSLERDSKRTFIDTKNRAKSSFLNNSQALKLNIETYPKEINKIDINSKKNEFKKELESMFTNVKAKESFQSVKYSKKELLDLFSKPIESNYCSLGSNRIRDNRLYENFINENFKNESGNKFTSKFTNKNKLSLLETSNSKNINQNFEELKINEFNDFDNISEKMKIISFQDDEAQNEISFNNVCNISKNKKNGKIMFTFGSEKENLDNTMNLKKIKGDNFEFKSIQSKKLNDEDGEIDFFTERILLGKNNQSKKKKNNDEIINVEELLSRLNENKKNNYSDIKFLALKIERIIQKKMKIIFNCLMENSNNANKNKEKNIIFYHKIKIILTSLLKKKLLFSFNKLLSFNLINQNNYKNKILKFIYLLNIRELKKKSIILTKFKENSIIKKQQSILLKQKFKLFFNIISLKSKNQFKRTKFYAFSILKQNSNKKYNIQTLNIFKKKLKKFQQKILFFFFNQLKCQKKNQIKKIKKNSNLQNFLKITIKYHNTIFFEKIKKYCAFLIKIEHKETLKSLGLNKLLFILFELFQKRMKFHFIDLKKGSSKIKKHKTISLKEIMHTLEMISESSKNLGLNDKKYNIKPKNENFLQFEMLFLVLNKLFKKKLYKKFMKNLKNIQNKFRNNQEKENRPRIITNELKKKINNSNDNERIHSVLSEKTQNLNSRQIKTQESEKTNILTEDEKSKNFPVKKFPINNEENQTYSKIHFARNKKKSVDLTIKNLNLNSSTPDLFVEKNSLKDLNQSFGDISKIILSNSKLHHTNESEIIFPSNKNLNDSELSFLMKSVNYNLVDRNCYKKSIYNTKNNELIKEKKSVSLTPLKPIKNSPFVQNKKKIIQNIVTNNDKNEIFNSEISAPKENNLIHYTKEELKEYELADPIEFHDEISYRKFFKNINFITTDQPQQDLFYSDLKTDMISMISPKINDTKKFRTQNFDSAKNNIHCSLVQFKSVSPKKKISNEKIPETTKFENYIKEYNSLKSESHLNGFDFAVKSNLFGEENNFNDEHKIKENEGDSQIEFNVFDLKNCDITNNSSKCGGKNNYKKIIENQKKFIGNFNRNVYNTISGKISSPNYQHYLMEKKKNK